MKYTRALPTKDGFYWHRKNRYKREVVVEISVGRINSPYFPLCFKCGGWKPEDIGGEWCGPLQEPGANCEPCIEDEERSQ